MKNLKQIKSRISTISGIKKTTKAMQLIAATKLGSLKNVINYAQSFYNNAKQTFQITLNQYKYFDIEPKNYLEKLLLDCKSFVHNNKKHIVFVISANQGLCGSFNQQLFKFTNENVRLFQEKNDELEFVTYGKKAHEFYSKRFANNSDYTSDSKNIVQIASNIASNLIDKILANECNEITICANHFKNMISQECKKNNVFGDLVDYYDVNNQLFALETEGLLEATFKTYLHSLIYYNIISSKLGEESSRVMSMDNASKNANKMIDSLTLIMNRARQAMVTKELIEITTSAELLQ